MVVRWVRQGPSAFSTQLACLLLASLVVLFAPTAHAQPVWQEATTARGSSSNAVIARPSGTVQGDLLVAGVMFDKGSDGSANPPSAEWTLIRRTTVGSDVGIETYYKIAGSSEPLSYTFELDGATAWSIGISRITGANPSNTIDVSGGTTGDSSMVTAPSVTTSVANTLVLAFYTNKNDATYTPAAGTDERYDFPNTSQDLPSNMLATFVQANAAATGPKVAQASQGEKWVGQQVAIRPSIGSPPPAPSLVSPADGASVTTSTPTFDWTDVTDPDGDTVTYEIQADNDGCAFSSPEVNQTGLPTSTLTPGSTLADGTYCWRARAVDQNGNTSPWSATRNLIVDAVPGSSQTMSPDDAADCTSLGGSGANWSNSGNAASSNNQRATATVDGTTTDPLRCLDYRFTIPPDAIILGIEVNVERRSSSTSDGGSRDNSLFLVKAGSAVGASGADSTTTYTTTDFVDVHGSPSDLWGTTWTPAEINAADFGTVFTAIKPSSAGSSHTVSVDHIEITVYYIIPAIVAPGSFNAFETSTADNAITGQVFTKRAAASFAVDVVAISSGAQMTSFTDTVQVDLVTGSTGGADCPGSPATIGGTTQSVSLGSGRGTTGSFNLASAAPDVRVRIRYPVASPTVTSCSTDNFAVRPSSITVASSDATNNGTSGAPAIKTGAPFSLTASTGVAGYNGVPTIDNLQIVGSPNAGAIGGSFSAANPATGAASGSGFFYSEAGNFGLSANAVRDTTFTAVDQPSDCTADFSNALVGGKYGCYFGSAAIAMTPGSSGFGRFIPDNFNVTYNAPSFTTSCGTFTYVGESLPYATAPEMTVIARSGTANGLTNTTTLNYAGAYMKLANTNTSLNQAPYDTQAGRYARFDALGGGATPAPDTAMLPATTADPAIGTFTNGVGTLTFASGLAFVRSATTPSAPFDADIALSLSIIDGDGVIFASNPARFGQASAGNGMAFSGAKAMRYGRLRLENAVGSEQLNLPIPIQTQYWTGTAFQTNGADNCTALNAANISLSDHFGGITPANLPDANITVGGAFAAGVGSLSLTRPSPVPGSPGAVTLTVDLTAAAKSYLKGNWGVPTYTADPQSRAAFGLYGGQPKNFIYFRENY